MSIITKFILFFSLIFLTISIGIFYFILGYAEDNLRRQVSDDLTIVAEAEEGYLLTFFEQIKGRAVDFSTDGLIRNYAEEIIIKKNTSSEVKGAFNIHLQNNKQSIDKTIKGILIIDLNGKVVASTNDREIGRDESNDQYFIDMNNRNLIYGSSYISDIFVSHHFEVHTPVILVGAPLFTVDKQKKLGYIVNQISLEEITKILNGTKQVELGAPTGISGRRATLDVYLVNKDNFLATPSIYANEGLLKQEITSPLVGMCRQNKEGSGIYNDYHGQEVLGVSMCLPLHNLTLLTEISTDEAFSLISDLRKDIFIFGIVFLVFLIIISALFLYRFIIKSIFNLKEGVKIVGAGNLSHEIILGTKDEFNDLAQDFNNMTRRLKMMFDGLELSSKKIKESEEKYRIMFDGAVDAIFIADSDGNFMEVNKNAERLTGYKGIDLLKMNHLQIYSKEDVLRCQEQFRVALQKNVCFIENVKILKKGGGTVTVDIGISFLSYGEREILQFIVRDVSERAALEEHHKEIDHLKSQFINVVSHQLRTPLNSIRWNIEVLLSGDLGDFKEDQEKFIKSIYLNNQNIMNIISDLFLALEIEEYPMSLEKEIVDPDILINSLIDGVKNSLAIKHLKLNFIKSKKGQVISVEADRDKLAQVFSRLVDNAIKYTKENGEINIKIEQIENQAVISFADNGIGIPTEERESLFTKFFRASNASLMYPNASGLGLFISKKIVESHGGKIWFNSEEGKGTTFFVSLPLVK